MAKSVFQPEAAFSTFRAKQWADTGRFDRKSD
jgi:hypothetical protein